MLFSGPDNRQPWGDLEPHLTPRPHESAPNGISIGSAVFAQYIRVTERQTDTLTDRPRYVYMCHRLQ